MQNWTPLHTKWQGTELENAAVRHQLQKVQVKVSNQPGPCPFISLTGEAALPIDQHKVDA